jgi:hypothetical protein
VGGRQNPTATAWDRNLRALRDGHRWNLTLLEGRAVGAPGAPVRLRQLAARLEEVQACNSEPRIGEPEAILVAYAECFEARIQETRTLGSAPFRVYVVTGGGSWTVEGGFVTSYRK